MIRPFLAAACLALSACTGEPELPPPNYDEALVPDYTLPDPLVFENGAPVHTPEDWRERRSEIRALLEEHVYGTWPEADIDLRFETRSTDPMALNGAATRKEVRVFLTDQEQPALDVLMYLPNEATVAVPVFLALNFYGNHSIHPDPDITLSTQWMRSNDDFFVFDNRATEQSRGVRSSRWPVERILARGYGLATVYYGDIDPDFDDGFQNGVHPLFPPDPHLTGSIGAWAWGLSRTMDYLVTDPAIDAQRVIVMGHSRLGKAALWAGANDERFAAVISNNSGAGGAALSRRKFGETVEVLNTRFPHWFGEHYNRYNNNEASAPVDQHMLLSLVAPRPLYIASAQEDQWADPRGEFTSARHAAPVFTLLGTDGLLGTADMPGIEQPVMGRIGYHIRRGPHDVTNYDWDRFMDFADLHLPR